MVHVFDGWEYQPKSSHVFIILICLMLKNDAWEDPLYIKTTGIKYKCQED